MTRHRLMAVCALAMFAAADGQAQYPIGAAGLSVSTDFGGNAGSFCWGFSCVPAGLSVTAGETVTIRITGEWTRPYLLGVSASAASCQAVPGVYHAVVLDAPVAILASGALSSISPILSCPPGFTTLTATVPAGIPIGTTFAIQALTYGAGDVLSLTSAIVLTIA